jgi:hypothetical protein
MLISFSLDVSNELLDYTNIVDNQKDKNNLNFIIVKTKVLEENIG